MHCCIKSDEIWFHKSCICSLTFLLKVISYSTFLYCVCKHPLVWKQVWTICSLLCHSSSSICHRLNTFCCALVVVVAVVLKSVMTFGQLSLQTCCITLAGLLFMCNLPSFWLFSLFDTDATGSSHLIEYIFKKKTTTLPVETWHLLGIWDWQNFVHSGMVQFNGQQLIWTDSRAMLANSVIKDYWKWMLK